MKKMAILMVMATALVFAAQAQAWSGGSIDLISCGEADVTLTVQSGPWGYKITQDTSTILLQGTSPSPSSGVKSLSIGVRATDNAEHKITVEIGNASNLSDGHVSDSAYFVNCGPIVGTPGPTGPKGDKGDTGATGSTGLTGAKGDKGDTGPAGATGPKGDTGAAGAKGDNGATGSTGATGASGTNGANGANGSVGPAGVAGPAGAPGSNGVNGRRGATGKAGLPGKSGKVTVTKVVKCKCQCVKPKKLTPKQTCLNKPGGIWNGSGCGFAGTG